jgi:hypothetical protein
VAPDDPGLLRCEDRLLDLSLTSPRCTGRRPSPKGKASTPPPDRISNCWAVTNFRSPIVFAVISR